MNEVQGLPEAKESDKESSRQEAQKTQELKSHLATFALLGGYSIRDILATAQAPGGQGQPSRRLVRSSCRSEGGSNRCGGSICPQIGCKCFKMNGLANKLLFGQSNPVKVNQGCLNGGNRHSSPKAPEDWRTPKRFAPFASRLITRSVLECGGPPPLWECGSTVRAGKAGASSRTPNRPTASHPVMLNHERLARNPGLKFSAFRLRRVKKTSAVQHFCFLFSAFCFLFPTL